MITYFEKRHNSLSYRILSAFIAFTFIFSLVLPPGYAQFIPQTLLNLPAPGMMVTPTSGFAPAMVTGITIHPDNPLRFDFIMDRGQSGLAGEPLKEEYTKMIKYFMASLTVPEDELWVNLSPYEKDRMVPQGLGDTEMGRDMLAQDYLLKQLTASLMYPEKELGKEFWNKVYKEAQEKFGTTEIPVNTFNKVWIVPDEALVYEQGTSAFVIKSRLGVMLEQDYKAMSHKDTRSQGHNDMGDAVTATEGSPRQRSDVVTTGIIREVIIPAIEQEINEGKNFASLRQIYNALILATWYKQRLKDSLLGKVYVDQNKTRGIDTQDKGINQKIYGQYIESFKRGVYNFIKEDVDPATQEIIPRKYFSGGMAWKLGGLKTVGALALGTLLSFGSPDFGNASAFAAAAMGGNKDGVTTEFVDNAQQGDVGTAIVVKEGAVQPVLLTGMWGKWVEERRLRQEEQRKFYEEMGGDWGLWQQEQYRKTYERLMVLSTTELIDVIKQEGYPTLGVGADILAERKDRSTVKPLIELYRKYLPTEAWQKEGPFYARADFVSAIGRIGGDEAKRFLQETVKNDPSPTVRDVAKQKLLSLSTKSIAGEDDWGQRQEERYQKTYDRLVVLLTAEIINVISQEGYPTLGVGANILAERKDLAAVKPLIELYREYLPTETWQKEGPFYARADLVSAIGRIGGDEAKRFLQETVKNDPSSTVRDVAKQQLLRLSSEPASSPLSKEEGARRIGDLFNDLREMGGFRVPEVMVGWMEAAGIDFARYAEGGKVYVSESFDPGSNIVLRLGGSRAVVMTKGNLQAIIRDLIERDPDTAGNFLEEMESAVAHFQTRALIRDRIDSLVEQQEELKQRITTAREVITDIDGEIKELSREESGELRKKTEDWNKAIKEMSGLAADLRDIEKDLAEIKKQSEPSASWPVVDLDKKTLEELQYAEKRFTELAEEVNRDIAELKGEIEEVKDTKYSEWRKNKVSPELIRTEEHLLAINDELKRVREAIKKKRGGETTPVSSPVGGEIKELSLSSTPEEIIAVRDLVRAAVTAQKFDGDPDAVALARTLMYEGKQMRFEDSFLVSFQSQPIFKYLVLLRGPSQQPEIHKEIYAMNGKSPIHFAPGIIYLQIPGDAGYLLRMQKGTGDEVFYVKRISSQELDREKELASSPVEMSLSPEDKGLLDNVWKKFEEGHVIGVGERSEEAKRFIESAHREIRRWGAGKSNYDVTYSFGNVPYFLYTPAWEVEKGWVEDGDEAFLEAESRFGARTFLTADKKQLFIAMPEDPSDVLGGKKDISLSIHELWRSAVSPLMVQIVFGDEKEDSVKVEIVANVRHQGEQSGTIPVSSPAGEPSKSKTQQRIVRWKDAQKRRFDIIHVTLPRIAEEIKAALRWEQDNIHPNFRSKINYERAYRDPIKALDSGVLNELDALGITKSRKELASTRLELRNLEHEMNFIFSQVPENSQRQLWNNKGDFFIFPDGTREKFTASSPATDLEKLARRLDVAPKDVDGVIEEYARAVGEIVERIPVVLTSSKQRKAVDLFMDPSSRPADVIIGLIYKQEYISKERIDELRGDAWKMVEGPGLGISVDGVGPVADFFRGEKGLENLYGKTVPEDLRGDFRLLKELLETGLPGLTLTRVQISDKTAIRNVIKDTILAASSRVDIEKEIAGGKKVGDALHTVLSPTSSFAGDFLKGGYKQPGYGVEAGAVIDGSHAIGGEGNQGYYVDRTNVPDGKGGFKSGKQVFVDTVNDMKMFFARRAEFNKPIRVVIKTGIGGQHTPFQGMASVFERLDSGENRILGEYELGEDFESYLTKIVREMNIGWDQIAVIPSSKSGSTDETMIVFTQIIPVLLGHVMQAHVNENAAGNVTIDQQKFGQAFLDYLHTINFKDGKELPAGDLFKNFNLEDLVVRIHEDAGPNRLIPPEWIQQVLGKVLGNMFFETTDRPAASRLSAFIRNSGLDRILGKDAPGFGAMFDNVGGRWTGDLHMMTFLSFYDLDPQAYWQVRYEGIKQVREGTHQGNAIGNKILDKDIKKIALVVPDEYFWFGKSIEQNFNESIWQEGFANLRAIKQSTWEKQKRYYGSASQALVLNLADLAIEDTFNVVNIDPVRPNSKQELAQEFGRLLTTFYGMTYTVGTRLIARDLFEEGDYRGEGIDVNDLKNRATKILQVNLFLRQPFVELGKNLLEKRLTDLQAAQQAWINGGRQGISPVDNAVNAMIDAAQGKEIRVFNPFLNVRELPELVKRAAFDARQTGRTFVPFIYLAGEEFVHLRDYLQNLGIEWVLQGSGDQHISWQQVLAQPDNYLPFIISFVPWASRMTPGLPAVGFAKGYLDNISPHMVRDYFAEASYQALVDQGGEGIFMRILDTQEMQEELKAAFEAAFASSPVRASEDADGIIDRMVDHSQAPGSPAAELLKREPDYSRGVEKISTDQEIISDNRVPVSSPAGVHGPEEEVGGINLDPALLDLQIRRDGNGVPLPLPMQPIKNMHIEGFLPIIINVTPITNLPMLLGLADTEQDADEITPAMKARHEDLYGS